jgi:hypothetical protein
MIPASVRRDFFVAAENLKEMKMWKEIIAHFRPN